MPRGPDQDKRKKRGEASALTKETRARDKNAKVAKKSADGYQALFRAQTAPASAPAQTEVVASAPSESSAPITECEQRRDAPLPPDIVAELDDDEQLEEENLRDGVMQRFLRAVQDRLKEETKNETANSLIDLLKENDWWLRAVHYRKVCKIIGQSVPCEPSYLRDIYVWLPDVRWGPQYMLYCPTCAANTRVGVHCWRYNPNHIGRRVCNLTTHYFALSRRYICHTCHVSQVAPIRALRHV